MDLTPATAEEAAAALAEASRAGRTVVPVGGGTRSRRGWPRPAAVRLSTARLDRLVDHAPDDLTVTVEGGMPATALADLLAAHGQCWPQADVRPGSTVGGVLAAAASGRGRLRYGPVRDSLLEVVLATGDGRLVTGGGRTVKGVAGYDLPRLAVGSLGTLGVIVQATLKLWPAPPARGWFAAEGPEEEMLALAGRVAAATFRPAALIATPRRLGVEIVGPAADVVPPAGTAPGPPPPAPAGRGLVEAGVPPAMLPDLVRRLAAEGHDYEARLGVGTALVAVEAPDAVRAVRAHAVALGGHAQVVDAPDDLRDDPFGPPPPGLAIMRRLRAAFDPAGILAPGRFVGDAA